MDGADPSDICEPITNVSAVLGWKCDGKCWIHKHNVANLKSRSTYLNTGYALDIRDKHDVFSEFKLPIELSPSTIFCHDYKGGYVEDRFCNGTENINTYRFFNWAGIDIFIYFSHKLVTIPTQGWLNAGHIHGVPVLGTLITEWDEGEAVWRGILLDNEKINLFCLKLAEICAHYKFDGYLLNVENVIPKDFIPRLIQFVALLKAQLDLVCGRQTWLIWYDSVTVEGKLEWQNKLCPLNKPFFDACDGIFLNYVWKPADLIESIDIAGTRKHDVYVGLDIWGRNCYQDGGFNVDKALAVIRNLNMSVALFGLGWTLETLPEGDNFLEREITFWRKFWPYLHIHGPSDLPFQTNFCQGISFNKETRKPWFNLGMQEYQPSGQGCSDDLKSNKNCISLFLDDGLILDGACLKITASCIAHAKLFHRVFACNFSGASNKNDKIQITIALKNYASDPASRFRIYFVIEDDSSVEGKKSVSMITKPKGYRSSVKIENICVTGSIIDFTEKNHTSESKIQAFVGNSTTVGSTSSWDEVLFQIELDEGQILSEILLLPASEGSILWGHLKIENVFD